MDINVFFHQTVEPLQDLPDLLVTHAFLVVQISSIGDLVTH